jgi:hypothetical protein
MITMVAFGFHLDIVVKCDVRVACPVCRISKLQLVWARRRFRFCGIPTVTSREGFYLKCPHCLNEDAYGPLSAELANELQEK